MGDVVALRPANALGLASEALRLAIPDPHAAVPVARAALDAARASGDVEAEVVAERALGVAARSLDDLHPAIAHLERAITLADGAGLRAAAAEARSSLVHVLGLAGRTADALREADRAMPDLSAPERARLHLQRAQALQRAGRAGEALDAYRVALSGLRAAGDTEREAFLLNSRGVLHAYAGRHRAAVADLQAAMVRHLALGQAVPAANARHNLGWVASRAGDVAAALRHYDAAAATLAEHGVAHPTALLDRSETLLVARLVPEARELAGRAAGELERAGLGADLAEARLLQSRGALLAGDAVAATAFAERALAAFEAQSRPGWVALARHATLLAEWQAGRRGRRVADLAERAAVELGAAGWRAQELDARVVAGRLALEDGRLDDARRHLSSVAPARRRGPAELRARAWHAEALLRLAGGDARGADVACRAGADVLTRHQATLGATELRVHAASAAAELGELGLDLAIRSRDPGRVLAWAERRRAGALRLRPARPAADPVVAGQLAELRSVVAEIEDAGFHGRATRGLLRRQAELEDRIRRRTWQGASAGAAGSRPPTVAELAAALGPRALVELVEHDGWLGAVTVVDGRARLHRLGDVGTVAAEVANLRFAVGRLARPRGSDDARAAALAARRFAAERLDELVLAPLARTAGDRPLVVVPSGPLHALPWATLPSCRGRSVAVAPSAALWLRAATTGAPAANGDVVLVAGPGVTSASREVAELAGAYPGARVFDGDAATAANVATAVEGARLVHIACHGTFRADNPLFSSLRLSGGPLTVYDLESLRDAPARLVLSACDVGLSAVRPGDELMGVTSAVLSLGSTSLVAAVVPVPDEAGRALMVDFHRRMLGGGSPADALAAALEAGDAPEGFVCFGA